MKSDAIVSKKERWKRFLFALKLEILFWKDDHSRTLFEKKRTFNENNDEEEDYQSTIKSEKINLNIF